MATRRNTEEKLARASFTLSPKNKEWLEEKAKASNFGSASAYLDAILSAYRKKG